MTETFKSSEEYIFKAEFNEDYGLQFMPTGESIVRCKDCGYCSEKAFRCEDGDVIEYSYCSQWGRGTDANGYCHKGVKMEELEE